MKDGRALGYDEYGTPGGKPVFYFHGHPGARIEWPRFHDDGCAKELNARIIAVDHPGHGPFDFQRGRAILDWPDDVMKLADTLGIERFAVLAYSGGGPHASACAFKIPERLTAAAVVCGMGPAHAPGTQEGMSWIYAGKGSVMRRLLLMLTAMGLKKQPERFAAQRNAGLKGPDKALLIDKPEFAAKTIDVFREAFRAGTVGVHDEAGLYRRPWGFRLQEINAEVYLWHAEQDYNVLTSVGRYVANAIPNCRTRFVEDEGHLTVADRCVREYLSVLVA